jgi:hypothetical protein
MSTERQGILIAPSPDPSASGGSVSPPPETPAKKKLWDTILTSTPVLMTVLATVLAGLSASEMTSAQYDRATAAQNQSKVGDEYNFFQAKRIRGTTLEMTATLLHALAEPGPLDADHWHQTLDVLVEEINQADKEVNRLAARKQNLTSTPPKSASEESLTRLRDLLQLTSSRLDALQAQALDLRKKTAETLAQDKVGLSEAFTYLQGGLPMTRDVPMQEIKDLEPYAGAIGELVQAAAQRRSEADTIALVRTVPVSALQSAYELSVDNSNRFKAATDKLKKAFATLNKLFQKQLELARSFHRIVRALTHSLPDPGSDPGPEMKEANALAQRLTHRDQEVKDGVEQLFRDFKAALSEYEARRYDKEAQYNQANANLYELQVRKSNFESDRHMLRKTILFFAMLAAQGGVTIATLALAMRRRNLLWGFALLAGMLAVSTCAYVTMGT